MEELGNCRTWHVNHMFVCFLKKKHKKQTALVET